MENGASPRRLVQQALVLVAGVDEAEANDVVEEGLPASFAKFKVDILKKVIKTLKSGGYYQTRLSVTANKPELIQMLVAVINSEGAIKAATGLPIAATAVQKAAPPVQHAHVPGPATVRAPAASAAAPGPFSAPAVTHAALHNLHTHPSASAPSSHKKAKHQHDSAAPGSGYKSHKFPKPPGSATHSSGSNLPPHPSLNSSRKVQAYRTLKTVAGIKEEEILAELALLGPSEEIDEDMVLFNIVAKRTVSHDCYVSATRNGVHAISWRDCWFVSLASPLGRCFGASRIALFALTSVVIL
jgi:hypothetical protein